MSADSGLGRPIELNFMRPPICPRDHVPETKRILFRGDEGSLSESVFLKELLSGRTCILSGPRLIQLIKFRIVSGTMESLLNRVTTWSQLVTEKYHNLVLIRSTCAFS